MTSKLGWHFQTLPGWAAGVVNSEWVKIIDPGPEHYFPGKYVIGRIYIPDNEVNALVMRGATGADMYFERCRPGYRRAPYCFAFEGPNEPPVATPEQRAALVAFTRRWVERMHAEGRRTVALCLSTGWPDVGTAGELAGALGETDFWALHEYSAPAMQSNESWLCLRYRRTVAELTAAGSRIPPLLITECGIDGGVVGQAGRGWKSFTSRESYLSQLAWYDGEIQKDGYVRAAVVFTSGPNWDWDGFDVDEGMSRDLATYIESQRGVVPPVVPPDSIRDALVAEFGAQFSDLRASLPRNGVYPDRKLSTISKIVVHHSATAKTVTWQQIANYHVYSQGWPGIGYHVGIGPDGSVALLNDLERASYHCGTLATPEDDNAATVGVCLVGNFETEQPTSASVGSLTRAIGVIDRYVGTAWDIIGHKDITSPAETLCPGKNLYVLLSTLRGAPREPLPTDETATDAATLAVKVRWWMEEFTRQWQTGNLERAKAIIGALIDRSAGLMYRLENALKE